jgi:hypothetical protein
MKQSHLVQTNVRTLTTYLLFYWKNTESITAGWFIPTITATKRKYSKTTFSSACGNCKVGNGSETSEADTRGIKKGQ